MDERTCELCGASLAGRRRDARRCPECRAVQQCRSCREWLPRWAFDVETQSRTVAVPGQRPMRTKDVRRHLNCAACAVGWADIYGRPKVGDYERCS